MGKEQEKKMTMTIEEAGRALGISRPTAYTLANEYLRLGKGLPCLRLGRRLVVPKAALEKLLQGGKADGQDGR